MCHQSSQINSQFNSNSSENLNWMASSSLILCVISLAANYFIADVFGVVIAWAWAVVQDIDIFSVEAFLGVSKGCFMVIIKDDILYFAGN